MKKILLSILFIISLVGVNAQFTNQQTIGSNKTLFKSLGGLGADSSFILLNSYADTTAANQSVSSKYNGSFIRVGTTIYYRTLSPLKWNALSAGASGTYLATADTSTMLSKYTRTSDTAQIVANRLKVSDTATMLSARPLNNRFADSIATIRSLAQTKGVGTLIAVATNTGSGISGGTITTSGTLVIDTLNLSTRLWRKKGTDSVSNLVNVVDLAKVNISDTAAMLSNRLKISDTATMLLRSPLVNRFLDTATALQTRIQTKLNISTAASTYVPYTGATSSLNLGANSLFGAASWENSALIYSGTKFKTLGNYELDFDSTGLYSNANGYRFYAVGAGLNSWYTPQSIVADKFVKIGGTGSQYLMADGTTTGTGGNVSSATYFPTLTNTTNISSSSANVCYYSQIGNIVTVSGQISFTTTSAAAFEIRISVPVAVTFGGSTQANGTFSDGITVSGAVTSFPTSSTVRLLGTSTTTLSRSNSFIFQYTVL